MKGITVNINRTLRQQVTVTANCEIEALAMVCGMLTRTNALDDIFCFFGYKKNIGCSADFE